MTNTISAGEIEPAGMASIDPLLQHGPVHVTARDTPRYVVRTEARYESLRRAQEEAQVARVRLAEAEIAAGRGTLSRTVAEHLAVIDAAEDEDVEPLGA